MRQIQDITEPTTHSDVIAVDQTGVVVESKRLNGVSTYDNDSSKECEKSLNNKSDISKQAKDVSGPTFHRNDSFNKAVNGLEEEIEEVDDKKSVGKYDYYILM